MAGAAATMGGNLALLVVSVALALLGGALYTVGHLGCVSSMVLLGTRY